MNQEPEKIRKITDQEVTNKKVVSEEEQFKDYLKKNYPNSNQEFERKGEKPSEPKKTEE